MKDCDRLENLLNVDPPNLVGDFLKMLDEFGYMKRTIIPKSPKGLIPLIIVYLDLSISFFFIQSDGQIYSYHRDTVDGYALKTLTLFKKEPESIDRFVDLIEKEAGE